LLFIEQQDHDQINAPVVEYFALVWIINQNTCYLLFFHQRELVVEEGDENTNFVVKSAYNAYQKLKFVGTAVYCIPFLIQNAGTDTQECINEKSKFLEAIKPFRVLLTPPTVSTTISQSPLPLQPTKPQVQWDSSIVPTLDQYLCRTLSSRPHLFHQKVLFTSALCFDVLHFLQQT
jgi:hypothetical protein